MVLEAMGHCPLVGSWLRLCLRVVTQPQQDRGQDFSIKYTTNRTLKVSLPDWCWGGQTIYHMHKKNLLDTKFIKKLHLKKTFFDFSHKKQY